MSDFLTGLTLLTGHIYNFFPGSDFFRYINQVASIYCMELINFQNDIFICNIGWDLNSDLINEKQLH